jgi:hypothetical protein
MICDIQLGVKAGIYIRMIYIYMRARARACVCVCVSESCIHKKYIYVYIYIYTYIYIYIYIYRERERERESARSHIFICVCMYVLRVTASKLYYLMNIPVKKNFLIDVHHKRVKHQSGKSTRKAGYTRSMMYNDIRLL